MRYGACNANKWEWKKKEKSKKIGKKIEEIWQKIWQKIENGDKKAQICGAASKSSCVLVMPKARPKALDVGRYVNVAFLNKRGMPKIWEGRVCAHKGRRGLGRKGLGKSPWSRIRFADGLHDVLLTEKNRNGVWWPCVRSKTCRSRAASSVALRAVRTTHTCLCEQ